MPRITKVEREKGREIFERGDIVKFERDRAERRAIVFDDKSYYNVTVRINQNNDLKFAKCNCKKSNKTRYCSHIAATLYAVTNDFVDRDTRLDMEIKDTIKKTIDHVPTHVLRKYLTEAAQEYPKIADKVFFAPEVQDTNVKLLEIDRRIKRLLQEIEEFSESYSEFLKDSEEYSIYGEEEFGLGLRYDFDYSPYYRERFDGWSTAIKNKLKDLLDNIYVNIIRRNDFKIAAQSVKSFVTCLEKSERPGMRNFFFELKEIVEDFWNNLIDNVEDPPYRRRIIEEFREDYADFNQNYGRDVAADILSRVVIEEANGNLGKKKRKTFIPDVFPGFEYNPVMNAHERLYAMWEHGYPKEEIEEYKEPYRRFPPILEFEDDYYSSRGEYDKAIEAVKTVLSYKDLTKEEQAPYFLRLAEDYKECGEPEKRKDALIKHVESIRQTDLMQLDEIKKLMSEDEWIDYILGIDEYVHDTTYMDLLMREEQKEALYTKLENFEVYVDLSAYDSYLLDEYGVALEAKRVQQFKERVAQTKGGEAYTQLVKDLEWLKVFPKGEMDIREIVRFWRTSFKRKNVLMDELDKAGY